MLRSTRAWLLIYGALVIALLIVFAPYNDRPLGAYIGYGVVTYAVCLIVHGISDAARTLGDMLRRWVMHGVPEAPATAAHNVPSAPAKPPIDPPPQAHRVFTETARYTIVTDTIDPTVKN